MIHQPLSSDDEIAETADCETDCGCETGCGCGCETASVIAEVSVNADVAWIAAADDVGDEKNQILPTARHIVHGHPLALHLLI